MRTLQENEMSCVSGGDDLGLAATAVVAPMALSVSSGVTGGAVAGVGAGGVVTGVALVPVAAAVVVAAGAGYIGYTIGTSAPVQGAADWVGSSWLGSKLFNW